MRHWRRNPVFLCALPRPDFLARRLVGKARELSAPILLEDFPLSVSDEILYLILIDEILIECANRTSIFTNKKQDRIDSKFFSNKSSPPAITRYNGVQGT